MALHAENEAHLKEIASRLWDADIPFVEVIEDDGQLMAIGCHPTRDRAKMKKVLSRLSLVK